VSGGKPARNVRKAVPTRIPRETKKSAQAARQRPRLAHEAQSRLKDAPLALVPRVAPIVGPVIEITPSPDEYNQLVRDLARLREYGAPSNTAAVVAAVHAASRKMPHGKHEKAGRR
jgi:hypothetical protein